jgi:type VI protein secretion system component VasF
VDRDNSLRERLELWSAALLAAATLTTAYSAYQATRWSGQQSTRFN